VWYNILDKNVMPEDPTCNKAVVLKMLLDQLVWAPFFSCIFFTFLHTLEVSM
jgi:protein Mpv17